MLWSADGFKARHICVDLDEMRIHSQHGLVQATWNPPKLLNSTWCHWAKNLILYKLGNLRASISNSFQVKIDQQIQYE